MTSGITFSGISSGLDTSSIITQLMQVESAPQTQLKNKVAAEQSQMSSLQQLNTALASLASSADSFAGGSTWTQLNATSSNAAITVNASSNATLSSINVQVDNRATSATAQLPAGTTADPSDTYTIYDNSQPPKALASFITGGTGSNADIAKAINASTTQSGLRAVVTHSDSGDVLQIVSSKTGDASNFSIQGSDGAYLVGAADGDPTDPHYTAGVPASLTVNGQRLHSDSNTVEVADGVTITLGAGSDTAGSNTSTVTIADDGSSRAGAMKTFIGQLNGILTTVASLTSYGTIPTDSGTAAPDGGVLPGDSTLRSLADQLVNTIFPSDGGSLEKYGISVDRDGQLTFDASAFTAAYTADPQATQAAVIGTGTDLSGKPLSESFVSRIQKVVANATYSSSGASSPFVTGKAANYDGMITAYIKSFQSQITDLNANIAEWDDRLAAKQASLQTTYTNLETVMSKLSAQSSWLSSQIDGLADTNQKN